MFRTKFARVVDGTGTYGHADSVSRIEIGIQPLNELPLGVEVLVSEDKWRILRDVRPRKGIKYFSSSHLPSDIICDDNCPASRKPFLKYLGGVEYYASTYLEIPSLGCIFNGGFDSVHSL